MSRVLDIFYIKHATDFVNRMSNAERIPRGFYCCYGRFALGIPRLSIRSGDSPYTFAVLGNAHESRTGPIRELLPKFTRANLLHLEKHQDSISVTKSGIEISSKAVLKNAFVPIRYNLEPFPKLTLTKPRHS